jgi:hypothetical protein
MTRLNRRTYLKGLGGSAVLLGGVSSLSGATAARADATQMHQVGTVENTWDGELPAARALLCETEMNGQYDIEMHLDGDPSGTQCQSPTSDGDPSEDGVGTDGGERTGVVHVTSRGHSTTDYAHGLVNLRARLSEPLTVGDLHEGVHISFDYYEGPDNERAAPDEAFVVFEGSVRSLDDIALARYDRPFAALSRQTKRTVAEHYRDQFDGAAESLTDVASAFATPFDELSDPTVETVVRVFRAQFRKGLEKYTMLELSEDRFTPSQTRSLYESQLFVPPLDDPQYSLDELADRQFGTAFDDLSPADKVAVTDAYRAQFSVDSHSLDEIAALFEESFETLSDATKLLVLGVFRRQFREDKYTTERIAERREQTGGPALDDDVLERLFLSQYVGGDQRRLYMAFETFNDGVEPDPPSVPCDEDNKRFRTLDVTENLFDDRSWTDTELTSADLMSGESVLKAARRLRDSGVGFTDPVVRYGADAHVVAVGFGAGFTTNPTVVDRYYDALRVRDDREDGNDGTDGVGTHEFDFPAAVPASARFTPPTVNARSGGTATATVTLDQTEMGLDLDDLDTDSVRLNRFSMVSPPVEAGLAASSVRVLPNDRVRVQFDAGELASFLGDGQQPVILTGLFDVPQRVTFVAVGRLSVVSPGPNGDQAENGPGGPPDDNPGRGGPSDGDPGGQGPPDENPGRQEPPEQSSGVQNAAPSAPATEQRFLQTLLDALGLSWSG